MKKFPHYFSVLGSYLLLRDEKGEGNDLDMKE
jgi:hypothetical protein